METKNCKFCDKPFDRIFRANNTTYSAVKKATKVNWLIEGDRQFFRMKDILNAMKTNF